MFIYNANNHKQQRATSKITKDEHGNAAAGG